MSDIELRALVERLNSLVQNVHQYIGARYVPNFIDEDWNDTTEYHALDVVSNGQGTSYIARKPVPVGTPLTNREYWFIYGATSGAILDLQNRMASVEHQSSYNTHFYNIKEFGGVGDGVTPNDTAITAALAAMDNHDTLYFPKGTYIFNNSVLIDKAIEVFGDGMGDAVTNTNGSGYGVTTLQFLNTGDCIRIAKPDCYIRGFYLHDLAIRGNTSNTDSVIKLINGNMCTFERLHIRNYDFSAITLEAESNRITQFTHITDCQIVYGAHTPTNGGHGIVLNGNYDNLSFVTQSYIENITCLTYNDCYIIKNSDNNIFTKCFGTRVSTGVTVLFDDYANFNYFNYLAGNVKAVALSKGNIIEHYLSEGGGVEIEDGGSLFYNVENYLNADCFAFDQFYNTKSLYISASDLLGCANSNQWVGKRNWHIASAMPISGATGELTYMLANKNLHNGKIKNIRLFYYSENASDTLPITIELFNVTLNLAPVANVFSEDLILTTDSPRTIRYIDLPADATFTKDHILDLVIKVVNAPTDQIGIVGMMLDYETTEPSGNGMGEFDHTPLS